MSDSTGKRRGKTPKTKEASSATAVVAPQNTTTSTKKPLPATFKDPDNPEQSRPRYAAGTVIGGKKVGGQPMSDEILKAARQGTQPAAQQSQQETTQQQEQPSQDRQPSRLQRIGATIARGARVAGALGPMGMIRAINRSATSETNTSLFNFEGMDARNVAAARVAGMGGGYGGSQTALSPRAERAVISTSSDMAAVRVSLGRIERSVVGISDKIGADTTIKAGASKPREGGEAGGGIMGLIGSLFGGLGNLFGGGGGAGIGALLRRSIGAIARAIFTKIPIIGPLILVALNIEGAMEEYEKNGLGAAITDLLSGIGSDLTFGLIDKDTIKNFINTGIAKVTEWWNSAKETLMGVIDSIIGGLRDFFGSIGNFFGRAVDDFNRARQRVREASERSEQERQDGLARMQPTPSGSPGQAGARGIASSYDISNRDYGDIQDMLMTPQAGETPEQRAERERLNELQRQQEAQAQSRGGNVQLGEGVAEYLARRRQEEFNQSISANENQYADLQNLDPAAAFRERSSTTTTPTTTATPAPERVQEQATGRRVAINGNISAELKQQIDSAARTVGQRARAGFISDGRVVAIESVSGQRIDIPSMEAPEQVPIPPDGRTQAMSQGTGQQATTVVPVPMPQAQQPAPAMQQSQGGGGAAAVGGAGTPPTTFPTTFSDPVSPAMVGNR